MNTTKTCPHCKKEVDLKATKCPFCRSDVRSWVRRNLVGICIVMIIFIPMIMADISETNSNPISQAEAFTNLKKGTVESLSRTFVRSTLKAPSTAKFRLFPSVQPDPKVPNQFIVISDVDSQNGFGAMLNNKWELKVKYIGAEDENSIQDKANYRIVEFYFDGEKIK